MRQSSYSKTVVHKKLAMSRSVTVLFVLPGVPQGSILGPIICNIFINEFINFIEKCDVHNYADDNTLSSFSNSINILSKSWKMKQWLLLHNKMIANTNNFNP